MGIYSSDDLINWQRQEKNILEEPGAGKDGGHPDVSVNGMKVFVCYFTNPGRIPENKGAINYETMRSAIRAAELKLVNRQITCDRDVPVHFKLKSKK